MAIFNVAWMFNSSIMTDFKYEGKDLEAMAFAKNYHGWILDKFRNFFGKKVAEVGAGSGSFSELLLSLPIEELVAVEPSKEMSGLLRSATLSDPRVTIRNEYFENVSAAYKDYFDSIVYVNVLEHIEDDKKELSYIYNSLKRGGNVCIFVPALSWLYSDFDRTIGHFRRYHKKPLKDLLEKAGFEIISIDYFDIIGILPWLIMLKILKKRPGSKNVSFYDRFVVPFSRFVEALIPLPVGKNLIAIAKKV